VRGALGDQGSGDDVGVDHEGAGDARADGVLAEAGEVVADPGGGGGVHDELQAQVPVLAG
jgi:hypothetical protein